MAITEILASLGTKVRALRTNKQLTIADVAAALDMSASQIGSIERADRCPSLPSLVSLAEFYQIPLSYLFEDDMYLYHRKVSSLLQDRMNAKNLSLANLAKMANINYFTLAEFFSGRTSLELDHFKRLAEILEITAEEIIPQIVKYISLIRYYLKALGLDEESIRNIEDYIYSKLTG